MIDNATAEMIQAAAADGGALVAFAIVVLGSFAIAIMLLLFFLLAVSRAWRWLTRHTWHDAITSLERKALQ